MSHADTSVVVPRSSIIVLPASLGDGVGVAGVNQTTCGITQIESCFPGNTIQYIIVFVNFARLFVGVDIMQLDIVRSSVVCPGLSLETEIATLELSCGACSGH